MTHRNLSLRAAFGALTGAFLSMALPAAAEEYPEELFPVDTMLQEKLHPVPGGKAMPYTDIRTFTRQTEAQCDLNKQGVGQEVQMEYYLLASPKDIGIEPVSQFEDNQMRRDAFVAGFGDDLEYSVNQIWKAALENYDGEPAGIAAPGDPKFVKPLQYALDRYFENFEMETGITAGIKVVNVEPGPRCLGV